jgi:hypothetical protein
MIRETSEEAAEKRRAQKRVCRFLRDPANMTPERACSGIDVV